MSEDAVRRRSRALLWGGLNALLLVAIAAMLNYLAFRHYERWDWTAHDLYTLSPRTKAVLAELDRPVEIFILLSESEPGFEELRNLLERYRAENERIQVRYVDPYRDPGAYREVAQRFRLGSLVTEHGAELADVAAVVSSGERHWEITRDDLLERELDPVDDDEAELTVNVESERALTGALVELTTGRATKVCVTRGHGELDPNEALAGFKREMERENLELETFETRGATSVPESCDAVAVLGPAVAFSDAEAALLREYVRGGGNLLVALDPVPNAEQTALVPLGLEEMLRDFGVRVDRSVVIEPNPALLPAGGGHPLGPYAAVDWGTHAVTEPFVGRALPLIVSEARSVRPIDEERATVLVRTSERSFAETDLRAMREGQSLEADADDIAGPVPLAVATEVEITRDGREENEDEVGDPGGRVVVIGDATMFATEYLSSDMVVNRAFASAVIGWLTQRQALIAIEPRTYRQRPVVIMADDVGMLMFRVAVLIPLAFVFLGVAVWWNRRQ
ncbi:MAG TPA: GldG family protein [Sandaracinaceae bacterium]